MNQGTAIQSRDTTRPQDHGAPGASARLQRRLRLVHLYLGMLFAPSLLFFAATGALQLFNLHEVRPGRAFQPPALLQELGQVHKNQLFALPRRHGPPPGAPAGSPAGGPRPEGPERSDWSPLALKIFFLLASVGLFVSTVLGVWIGLRSARRRAGPLWLLLAGAVIPVVLLAL